MVSVAHVGRLSRHGRSMVANNNSGDGGVTCIRLRAETGVANNAPSQPRPTDTGTCWPGVFTHLPPAKGKGSPYSTTERRVPVYPH